MVFFVDSGARLVLGDVWNTDHEKRLPWTERAGSALLDDVSSAGEYDLAGMYLHQRALLMPGVLLLHSLASGGVQDLVRLPFSHVRLLPPGGVFLLIKTVLLPLSLVTSELDCNQ